MIIKILKDGKSIAQYIGNISAVYKIDKEDNIGELTVYLPHSEIEYCYVKRIDENVNGTIVYAELLI